MSEEPLLWWATRASGLVSLGLLTAAVVLGLLATRGGPEARVRLQLVHRTTSGLALGLVLAHVVTAVADPFVDLAPVDAVVPGTAGFRTGWTALGALALDLLLAVLVTSLLRRRLSGPRWRRVHLLAWAAWPLAAGHAVGLGTDVADGAGPLVALLATGAVVAAALLRLLERATPLRLAAAVLLLTGAGSATGWALGGPLSPAVALPSPAPVAPQAGAR